MAYQLPSVYKRLSNYFQVCSWTMLSRRFYHRKFFVKNSLTRTIRFEPEFFVQNPSRAFHLELCPTLCPDLRQDLTQVFLPPRTTLTSFLSTYSPGPSPWWSLLAISNETISLQALPTASHPIRSSSSSDHLT